MGDGRDEPKSRLKAERLRWRQASKQSRESEFELTQQHASHPVLAAARSRTTPYSVFACRKLSKQQQLLHAPDG